MILFDEAGSAAFRVNHMRATSRLLARSRCVCVAHGCCISDSSSITADHNIDDALTHLSPRRATHCVLAD